VKIRQADRSDLDALLKLEEKCFGIERFTEATVLAFLARDDAFVLVAEDHGRIVGSVMNVFSRSRRLGRIASVAVMSGMRRRGIGERLVRASEKRFVQESMRSVRLEVNVENMSAIRLYLKAGFAIEAIIDGYYGTNRHAYVMSKDCRKWRYRPRRKVRVRIS